MISKRRFIILPINNSYSEDYLKKQFSEIFRGKRKKICFNFDFCIDGKNGYIQNYFDKNFCKFDKKIQEYYANYITNFKMTTRIEEYVYELLRIENNLKNKFTKYNELSFGAEK